MLVQSSLILDHFFFAAEDEAFNELKQLFTLLDCTNHQKVQADGDSWEGLYIWTRSGYYLEVLKERRPNCTGLCQKPKSPLRFDAREIIEELPAMPWQSFERSIEGQKWFTALSCDNYLDLTTPFNTWVMHYYQMNLKYQAQFQKYEIQSMHDFEIDADPALKQRIQKNSAWFNAEKNYEEDNYNFSLQTYYSDGLRMRIHFQPGVEGTQFKSLKIKVLPGFDRSALLALSMKHFALKSIEDEGVILIRKSLTVSASNSTMNAITSS